LVLLALYVGGVIYRAFVIYGEQKTDAQVEKIHATKLTLDDVLGKNLPPDPGAEADKTVAGVDANKNGIRDDVELAIFKEYPNSAKTRAVLLQYALALQMEVVQPIVNKETVIAVAQDSGRAHLCVGEVTSRSDIEKFLSATKKLYTFVEDKQWNTAPRVKGHDDFYRGNLDSFSSLENTCDLDLSELPN